MDPITGAILSSTDRCLPYAVGADISPVHGNVGIEGFTPAVLAIDNATGVEDEGDGSFTTGSNPAADDLVIDLPGDRWERITLNGMDGKTLRSRGARSGRQVPDVRIVATGAYMITFDGNERLSTGLMIAR